MRNAADMIDHDAQKEAYEIQCARDVYKKAYEDAARQCQREEHPLGHPCDKAAESYACNVTPSDFKRD